MAQVIDEQDHDWAEQHPLHQQVSSQPFVERLEENARQRDVVKAGFTKRMITRQQIAQVRPWDL